MIHFSKLQNYTQEKLLHHAVNLLRTRDTNYFMIVNYLSDESKMDLRKKVEKEKIKNIPKQFLRVLDVYDSASVSF